jgi:hypothetical protein
MDKSARQEFYEKRYFHELDAREKIEARIKTPMAMFVIVFGLIGYLAKETVLKSNFELEFGFWLFSGAAIFTFVLSLFFFFKTIYGYHYFLLPTPDDLEKYFEESVSEYCNTNRGKARSWASEAFEEYLFDCYVSYTSQNTRNNDAKALNLTYCIGALIFSFINICIAYIPYYYQTFLKGVNP